MKGKYTFSLSKPSAKRAFFSLYSEPIIYNKLITTYVIAYLKLLLNSPELASKKTGRSSPTLGGVGPLFLQVPVILLFFPHFIVKAFKPGQLEVFSLFKINFRTQLSGNLTAFIQSFFFTVNPLTAS